MATYLITGANRGIGLELCKQLTKQHHQVIAVCRQVSAELSSLNVRIEADIDVTDTQAIATLAKRLNNVSIDVLINNAGILRKESLDNMNFEDIRQQFEINALAPLQLSYSLLPNLATPSKIVLITSRMGSLEDNTSGAWYGYRMSKAALNMAAISLAHDLKSREIAVGIFHPGMVSTDMTSHQGISVEEAVEQLLLRCDELNINNSGQFRHANGEILPW